MTNRDKIMNILNDGFQSVLECSRASGLSRDITRTVLDGLFLDNIITRAHAKSKSSKGKALAYKKMSDTRKTKFISMKWC